MSRYTVHHAPQGSPEWLQARAGRLTGSRAADILATIKSGEAASRRNYRMELVCARLTGLAQPTEFVSDAMRWGTANEPMARAAYEAKTGAVVGEAGFLAMTDMAGCSLDGHIGDIAAPYGLIELKCPLSATHLGYLRDGGAPKTHLPQITHNLWVSGASFCDFVSFDPRFPPRLQLFIARVPRADLDIAAYEAHALQFLAEVAAEVAALETA